MPTSVSTRSFHHSSKWLFILWKDVSLLGSHLKSETFLWMHSCSFNGCTREFPTRGKLKHHEKVHEGRLLIRMPCCCIISAVCVKMHLSTAGYPCEDDGCLFQGKTWTEYQKHRKEHNGMNVMSSAVASTDTHDVTDSVLCSQLSCRVDSAKSCLTTRGTCTGMNSRSTQGRRGC